MVLTVTSELKPKERVIGEPETMVLSNHGSQVPVIGGVKVGGVTNSTTKLNRFEKVSIVDRNEFSNQVWTFGHQP